MNPSVFNLDDYLFPYILIILICFPFLPFMLIVMEHRTSYQLENCADSEVNETLKKHREVRKHAAKFFRTELGIENSLQITFSMLLLLFAISNTRVIEGLKVLFDETSETDELIFGIPPEIVLIVNNVWTFFSCFRTYLKRISWTKASIPLLAKCMLFGFVILSMSMSILANIVYLTPSLGLFSIFRHYQGENIPYYTPGFNTLLPPINVTTDLCYFSDVPPFPWTDLTRFNYSDRYHPTAPPTTIYTYFAIEPILIAFWMIWFIHIFVVWLVKWLSNRESYSRQNVLEAFINAMENCQIPAPMSDWDDYPGTIPDYVQRQKYVNWEMGLTMVVNLVKNLVMLIPMWIFGNIRLLINHFNISNSHVYDSKVFRAPLMHPLQHKLIFQSIQNVN